MTFRYTVCISCRGLFTKCLDEMMFRNMVFTLISHLDERCLGVLLCCASGTLGYLYFIQGGGGVIVIILGIFLGRITLGR